MIAADLFREFLERRRRGEQIAFDSWCRAHASCEGELRALHAEWQALAVNGDHGSLRELLDRLRRKGSQIGRYEVGTSVGRGGMGEVFQVWEADLRRSLAMKVIRKDGEPAGSSPFSADQASIPEELLARFLDEAQITGQLEHPGIVPVHELGLDANGRAYFTMRLIKGHDLKRVIDLAHHHQEGWSTTRALTVILRVCEAVAYAHSKRVIHRDLKPSNVMVGEFGEVYVMDWGLARVLDLEQKSVARLHTPHLGPSRVTSVRDDHRSLASESPQLTKTGSRLGTPHYMPPEQAAGRTSEVGPHSDVYAVGAMLYHLLTGRAPYHDADSDRVYERVVGGPPAALQVLKPGLPAELVAICDKAMARNATDRYADMQAMAGDLRAYLEQRVVTAYETGAVAELRKWVLRNKALAASLLGGVVTLAAGLIISLALYGREQVARGEAQANAEQARKNETRAKEQEERATRETKVALSLSGIKRLQELRTDADKLWPRRPHMMASMEHWLARAKREVDLLPQYESYLADVRAIVNRTGEQDWLLENLVLLLEGLKKLADPDPQVGLMADVRARLEVASTIKPKTIDEVKDEWESAIADIHELEAYHGLELEPQLGLIPLEPDPRSGLWEFWVWESGERPERDQQTGRLMVKNDTGIVLVLVPGGTVTMGAQKKDPAGPNYDPDAESNESPVTNVTLDAFFLSKYEMTQGQWLRVMGVNPSSYSPPRVAAFLDQASPLAHPVEQVTDADCHQALLRLGLVLPTEAQWEYGARAGTDAPWYVGRDKNLLKDAANIADHDCQTHGGPSSWIYEAWEDGYVVHAPVGRLVPNAFGLHDVLGNVWEWCRDWYGSYSMLARPGDGERNVEGASGRVARGGCFHDAATVARSASRSYDTPETRSNFLGCRPARSISHP